MAIDPSRISVVATALDADVRQASRRAREFGYAGMLFDAEMPGLRLVELSLSGRREVRQILAGQNQHFVGIRADLGPTGFGPGADIDRMLDRLDQLMQATADMSGGIGPMLCLEVGPLPAPAASEAPPAGATAPQPSAAAGKIILPTMTDLAGLDLPRRRPSPAASGGSSRFTLDAATIGQAMAELALRADRFGVTVALASELSSLAALVAIIAAAGCPWFGIDLDAVALVRDDWTLDELLSRAGPLIRHVRARDAIVGMDRRTRPAAIGSGAVDWLGLAAGLHEAAYQGWISVDTMDLPDRAGAAAAAAAYLR
jgi:sugar phosphate isomerase/epimerase